LRRPLHALTRRTSTSLFPLKIATVAICKKEKHICDALLKYYILHSDFLHHLILHKVCVEHKNTVYCPSKIDRVLSIPKTAFERM
ncbi:MAG: hypothetical protein ACP5H5_10540, partial [Pyrobaculum sp.]